jgi:stage V sporulation protein G
MSVEQGLKVTRLYRFEGSDSTLKAFADVAVGDFLIKGLRIVQGKKGLFLSMPGEQGKDGKWYDTFHPLTKEARQLLSDAVLEAYQE